ncbi:adhesion G protein-coupled receptor G7 [Phyllostomus discolor]|uniref:Adhesion G-protein coupled receptor G7 n=1 Tax=Phyllostomus discolor TaxID=89673 RepID=A0A7E6D3U1_9CHIR|nr:adhesion G-protein coupled receptor G7 [Phyllostomus discolor]KAF6117260.1 adhesion G protein-coupled receptor G7 [Phyllostomus discolor]
MASWRACDLRTLVAVVCGLLTTIVLGLGIWRAVVRIQRGTYAPPASTPTGFCRNGGTWANGRCICPEEWKGLRCTIANFCENSTYDSFTFGRIPVGSYGSSFETCEKDTLNAGHSRATRMCRLTEEGEIKLDTPEIGNCDLNLEILEKQVNNATTNISTISKEVHILTANVDMLTPENITSATKVVGQIFNTSREASPEAKVTAVSTVSQLLAASEDVFQEAASEDDNTFATLVQEMEAYSLSLGNDSVVSPNVAVQGVVLSSGNSTGSTGVRFTVQKGSSSSLVSGSTHVETNVNGISTNSMTELQIWLEPLESNTNSCSFIVYQNDKLFQSKTFKTKLNFTQKVISGKTDGKGDDQNTSVKMAFRPQHNPKEFKLHSYACVFWNFSKKDWDTNGCHKDGRAGDFVHCCCNHTTNFAVLMSFKKNYKYPESLDVLSIVGCALSISGLALTIIFQIVTRRVRKTSVTWVLVSLCTSMLIFNLLFVFGIENSNKKLSANDTQDTDSNSNEKPKTETVDPVNPKCTAVAALLHYFLLVTFTWSGLSAAQLYYLLIRTMKPLPQRFILFISLIGWGVPAIVVAVTVGIIFSQNSASEWELKYRQEAICWLAVLDGNDFIRSPLLWSLILPVTIILITNIVIFIVITVKVLWKNNQNLTSTKKFSSLKKILSTLSVAVVFGVTWILAFLMLTDNEDIRIIFSYIFCLLNTTQGLQIFIFYTVRTPIFQNEASKVLRSLSSSAGRVKMMSSAPSLRLRVRMYNMLKSWPTLNEHFRLLDPSVVTEETTLSESDQTQVPSQ